MRKAGITGLLAVLMAGTISAAELESLRVEDGYVRGLPPTSTNTAAYMRLVNEGDSTLQLIGATSPVAEQVMLHESFEEGGLVSMRHVAMAEVPAGGELQLRSGGLHLMLMRLTAPLSDGDEVQLVLEFAEGDSKTVTLPVRSVVAENQGPYHGHGN